MGPGHCNGADRVVACPELEQLGQCHCDAELPELAWAGHKLLGHPGPEGQAAALHQLVGS